MQPRGPHSPRQTSRAARALRSGITPWLIGFGTLTFIVVLVALVTATTRPLPREDLPRSANAVAAELRALHHGGGACVRWADDDPLPDDDLDAFLTDLSQLLVLDLQTVLPTLASLRHANRTFALAHHDAPPVEEFTAVAVDHLPTLDQLRARLRPDLVTEALPRLESFDREDERDARDLRHANLLTAHLTDAERQHLDALVERWRVRLAGARRQRAIVDRVARRVTELRLAAIAEELVAYRQLFGSFPASFAVLLTHLRNIERLPPIIERGLFPDGSLRDGWLRPLTFYAIGSYDFRLLSLGPSASFDDDDIVLHRRGADR